MRRMATADRAHEAYDSDEGPSMPESGWVASEMVTEVRGPNHSINIANSRFPFAITWTPLPFISWFIPFIGHMGIGDSRGVVYDFAGPYMIGIDNMAFGKPTRYLTLDPNRVGRKEKPAIQTWDEGVDRGNDVYCKRMHNICCDNCHSHVARSLNEMKYDGKTNWNMVTLCFWVLVSGKFVSTGRAVQTWLPFFIIVFIIVMVRLFVK